MVYRPVKEIRRAIFFGLIQVVARMVPAVGFWALAFSLTSLCLAGGAGPEQKISSEALKAIQTQFENNLRSLRAADQGSERGFNSDDVNSLLAQTSQQIIKVVPADDAPLISYVKNHTPGPVTGDEVFVPKPEAEVKFSILAQMLHQLSVLNSLRLNLTVKSVPSMARFDLVSPTGQKITVATNTVLTNIYRGEYEYCVVKAGYKDIRYSINLIDQSGSELSCEFFLKSNEQEALPCNLK